MVTKLPEGFSPFTISVIEGKKGAKISCDICGCCFTEFTGKTAQESAEKLRAHILVCKGYVKLNASVN